MRTQKGFTLIEVLVALFILTGGIIVLSTAWSGNFMRIRKSALFNDVDIDPLGIAEPAPWEQAATDPQHLDQGHSGFDVFD